MDKFLYFTQPQCGVCHALLPKLSEFVAEHYPKMELEVIDCMTEPERAAQHSAFSVPLLLVFFEGKEFYRFFGAFSLGELAAQMQRPYQLRFED